MSAALKGKPKPNGFGIALSAARKGMIFTEEHRKNIGKASLGRTWSLSEATRKEISKQKTMWWAQRKANA